VRERERERERERVRERKREREKERERERKRERAWVCGCVLSESVIPNNHHPAVADSRRQNE
jgi:hypothetical protein